jgi:hypothetical protein
MNAPRLNLWTTGSSYCVIPCMPPVKETARIRLADLIIRPADVRKLASIVVGAGTALEPNPASVRYFAFSIITADKRSYESESPDLFSEEEGLLDTKPVWSVELRFHDSVSQSSIRVDVTHRNTDNMFNKIEVASLDRDWVAATVHKLQEAISSFEKQATWPRKWETPLVIVGAFGIGHAWDIVVNDLVLAHILHIQPITPRPQWVATYLDPIAPFVLWVANFMIGLAPSMYLTRKLLELWPSVELRMGRDWAQQEARKRNRLWLFFTVAIVPLLLSLLYDLLKPLFFH